MAESTVFERGTGSIGVSGTYVRFTDTDAALFA
jgi:hypothetical protein